MKKNSRRFNRQIDGALLARGYIEHFLRVVIEPLWKERCPRNDPRVRCILAQKISLFFCEKEGQGLGSCVPSTVSKRSVVCKTVHIALVEPLNFYRALV